MRRLRGRIALAVAALAAGAGAAALVQTSAHVREGTLTTVFLLLVGWSFVGSGLAACARRPHDRNGLLMAMVGFAWFTGALAAANDSVPFTIGLVVANVAIPLFVQLLLGYPDATPRSRLDRLLVAAVWLDVVGLQALALLFDHTGGTEPANALRIATRPGVVRDVHLAQSVLTLVLVVAILGSLARRWALATPPARRPLAPVLWSGALAVVAFGVLVALDLLEPGEAAGWAHWVALAALALVPLAFLLGLLRGRLARSAVGRLVVELGRTLGPDALRDALRRTLGDPSLTVAYHLPATGIFVDAQGRHVEVPGPGGERVATMVEREGRRVAALVHDASVCEDRTLLDAVAAAAALALENERLHAELRARLDELEEERDFMHATLTTAPSLLVVLDPEGRIVQFNQACERLTGYRFTEVRGKRFWDLFVVPEEADGIARALGEAATAPLPTEHENHWVARTGERRLIAWRNAALRDERGRLEYIVAGGLDVTSLRAHEGEIRASRARIVEAGDRERRRLERNLHDGAQQRLVALSLALRLARARLRRDPGEAERLIDAAAGELAQALEELRELARGIHPAVLTDRGLEAALEALAARSPVPVEVRDELDGRLPAPVEAAAYYVVAEALTNVAKYAQASGAHVTIARMNGNAVVEVVDDGVGGASPEAGSGLRGLVDRVEALEGTLSVASAPGSGTRVRAEIPCAW